MSGPEDIAPALLAPVRAVCTALPDVREVPAWIGVRWQVRKQTFAHLMVIEDGRPQAFVRAAGTPGPATVLTFRAASPELDALHGSGLPFFAAPWGPDVVGMVLDGPGAPPSVDWAEVAELLTESFLLRAPRLLREEVERVLPGPGTDGCP